MDRIPRRSSLLARNLSAKGLPAPANVWSCRVVPHIYEVRCNYNSRRSPPGRCDQWSVGRGWEGEVGPWRRETNGTGPQERVWKWVRWWGSCVHASRGTSDRLAGGTGTRLGVRRMHIYRLTLKTCIIYIDTPMHESSGVCSIKMKPISFLIFWSSLV